MEQLIKALESYGLNKKESQIYLKLRELGTVPIAPLTRQLGFNRVTIYSILQNLLQQGIVSSTIRNDVTYYAAISPEILQKNIEEKSQKFLEVLPDFMALGCAIDNKAQVQYYEGINGLKTVYQDVLDHSQDIVRMFMGVKYIHPEFKTYIDEEFVPERIKRHILARVIAPRSEAMDDYQNINKESYREMILVDREDFDFTNEIMIYGENKVAIAMFSSDEMSGMVISSRNVYKSLLSIFDLLYKHINK